MRIRERLERQDRPPGVEAVSASGLLVESPAAGGAASFQLDRDFISAVLQTAGVLVVVLDRAGRIILFNRACERLTGYAAGEVLGRAFWDLLLVPEEEPAVRAVFAELTAGRFPNAFENHWTTRDGQRRLIAWSNTALVAADGSVYAVIGTGIDISARQRAEEALRESRDTMERRVAERTAALLLANRRLQREMHERRQAEEALRASDRRLRSVCAAVPLGVFETDAELSCRYMNLRFAAVCGRSPDECRGAGWQACIHPQERAGLLAEVREALAADRGLEREFRLVRPDGTVGWGLLRTACARAADGALTLVGTLEDITARRRAEEQMRQHKAELERVSRLNTAGGLAAALAHELNQPLAVINNYAQGGLRLLRAGQVGPAELVGPLEQISAQAHRVSAIVRSLRDLIRKREPALSRVDLNDLVREALALMELEVRQAGARVRLELAPGLPTLLVDRIQIEHVLLNLLRNGLEAMAGTPPEQRALCVRTAAEGRQAVAVAVEDSGPGLPPGDVERVFEAFYTTKPEGMGIGLAVCRSIVEAHQGRLWAESEPGRGASFRFVLPIGGR